MAAPNLGRALIGAVAATAMTATAALADDTKTNEIELAQNFQGQATITKVSATPETTGASVVFQYGPGVDERSIASIVDIVNEQGCPASADSSGRPNRIIARIGDENHAFKDEASAAGWALEKCSPEAG